MGNNLRVEIRSIGTCQLLMRGGCTLFLHDVLFASEIRRNLVSVLVLVRFGFNVNFHNNGVDLSLGTSYYGSGYFLNDFIILDVNYCEVNISYSLFTSSDSYENDVNVWHARLGHIGQQRMNRLAKDGLMGNIKMVDLPTCEHYDTETIWKRNKS